MQWRVEGSKVGIMGAGSNPFRCGLAHSSGVIYIGTYGPQPAIVWKYDPKVGKLEKVGTPGEYQLDCMVEAPDGKIYIGTAYSALVYQLDPKTDKIKSLDSPPIESTSWIFTMVRTDKGEIYGAKGVGLFRLDWQNGKLEPIGLVPGDHTTPGPNASTPIVRMLVRAPDGTLYGDTNRWLFRFDPATREITPLADMVSVDDACYALFLPIGAQPTQDCYFALYSRFSGKETKETFYVYRSDAGQVEPLPIEGFTGELCDHPAWIGEGTDARLLVPAWHDDQQEIRISVVNPFTARLVERWTVPGNAMGARKLEGEGPFFFSHSLGSLFRADPTKKLLTTLAENPTPVECRCLAMSPRRALGADTWDCGFVFTRDIKSGTSRDHGKVWRDDHRCQYGPAAFAGKDGRYFLANHGQADAVAKLWVTDTETNRHRPVGRNALQLVAFSDGTVWGTEGRNLGSISTTFHPAESWTPARIAAPGAVFRYVPGEEEVEMTAALGRSGPIAEAPGGKLVLAANDRELRIYDPESGKFVQSLPLPADAAAAAHDAARTVVYLVLSDGSIHACRKVKDKYVLEMAADKFGPVDRGFFVLPLSGRAVGVANNGTVTFFDPESGTTAQAKGKAPLPAGPAVDTEEDKWYYADKEVVGYSLMQ